MNFLACFAIGFCELLASVCYAGAWTQPEGVVEFIPSFYVYSAEYAFATNGAGAEHPGIQRHIRRRSAHIVWRMGCDKRFDSICDIPFGHYNFFASDSLHNFSDQLTPHFIYVGIGGRYAIWRSGHSVLSVSDMLHIPPGFHLRLYNDSQYPFLSDGYVENISAMEFGTTVQWGWFEGIWHIMHVTKTQQTKWKFRQPQDSPRGET